MTKRIITLVDASDAHNFRVGLPIECKMTDDGRLVRLTWRDRLAKLWRRMTWWRHPPCMVTAIDRSAGSITIGGPMRWSWLRWKWLMR